MLKKGGMGNQRHHIGSCPQVPVYWTTAPSGQPWWWIYKRLEMVFLLTGLLSLEFSFQMILACLHHCLLMRDQV